MHAFMILCNAHLIERAFTFLSYPNKQTTATSASTELSMAQHCCTQHYCPQPCYAQYCHAFLYSTLPLCEKRRGRWSYTLQMPPKICTPIYPPIWPLLPPRPPFPRYRSCFQQARL